MSESSFVFRCNNGTKVMDLLIAPGNMESLQGTCWVATYIRGHLGWD